MYKIIYTTDVHEEADGKYDYDDVRELKQQLIEQGHKVLVLDGGDIFSKKNYEKTIDRVLNTYDGMTIGNHDMLLKDDMLDEIVEAGIPLMCCTYVDIETDEPVFKPYLIKDNIGIIFGAFKAKQKSKKRRYIGSDEYIEVVNKYIDELVDKGCKTIIFVSHNATDSCIKLAANLDHVSLILCGHGHQQKVSIAKNKQEDKVTIIEGGKWFNTICTIDIETKEVTEVKTIINSEFN